MNRMTRKCFRNLCRLLISEKGGLKALHTISIEEKIMMYIQVLKGQSIRVICEMLQDSSSTVSHIIHEVRAALMRCESQMIPKPNGGTELSDKIRNDSKFYPFFDNCDGALDGTHIPAVIPLIDQGVYRNRKKFVSQNVLGVCNFEMIFTYALTGWEGSAHDGKVLADAKLKGLPMRAGKYYLADAGYAISKFCLVPYRGVRYHLKEWMRGNQQPVNKEELFNLRHSSLRNVVERIFGVLKKRFPIVVLMSSYDFEFQCDIVLGAMMLHNFIRINQEEDDEFDIWDLDEEDIDNEENLDNEGGNNDVHQNELIMWRNGIASSMWDAYQLELNRRGLL